MTMNLWKVVWPILLMLLKKAGAALFGKRNRALIPIETDRAIIRAGDVTFEFPKLRSIGLGEEQRTLFISNGRSVVEIPIDDITELSITFQPKSTEVSDAE